MDQFGCPKSLSFDHYRTAPSVLADLLAALVQVTTLRGLADAAAAVLDKGEEEFLRFSFGAESQGRG